MNHNLLFSSAELERIVNVHRQIWRAWIWRIAGAGLLGWIIAAVVAAWKW